MIRLESVMILAMDIVKGPYVHCAAPANFSLGYPSSPTSVPPHTRGGGGGSASQGDNRDVTLYPERYQAIPPVNGAAVSEAARAGAPCSLAADTHHHHGDDSQAEQVSTQTQSPVDRLSGLSDVFVPRPEFCHRVMWLHPAESGRLYLYYPEEIPGEHYQRKTLRYSLCFVFRVDETLMTIGESLTRWLIQPYSVVLTNVVEELRDAEIKHGYMSRGLEGTLSNPRSRESRSLYPSHSSSVMFSPHSHSHVNHDGNSTKERGAYLSSSSSSPAMPVSASGTAPLATPSRGPECHGHGQEDSRALHEGMPASSSSPTSQHDTFVPGSRSVSGNPSFDRPYRRESSGAIAGDEASSISDRTPPQPRSYVTPLSTMSVQRVSTNVHSTHVTLHSTAPIPAAAPVDADGRGGGLFPNVMPSSPSETSVPTTSTTPATGTVSAPTFATARSSDNRSLSPPRVADRRRSQEKNEQMIHDVARTLPPRDSAPSTRANAQHSSHDGLAHSINRAAMVTSDEERTPLSVLPSDLPASSFSHGPPPPAAGLPPSISTTRSSSRAGGTTSPETSARRDREANVFPVDHHRRPLSGSGECGEGTSTAAVHFRVGSGTAVGGSTHHGSTAGSFVGRATSHGGGPAGLGSADNHDGGGPVLNCFVTPSSGHQWTPLEDLVAALYDCLIAAEREDAAAHSQGRRRAVKRQHRAVGGSHKRSPAAETEVLAGASSLERRKDSMSPAQDRSKAEKAVELVPRKDLSLEAATSPASSRASSMGVRSPLSLLRRPASGEHPRAALLPAGARLPQLPSPTVGHRPALDQNLTPPLAASSFPSKQGHRGDAQPLSPAAPEHSISPITRAQDVAVGSSSITATHTTNNGCRPHVAHGHLPPYNRFTAGLRGRTLSASDIVPLTDGEQPYSPVTHGSPIWTSRTTKTESELLDATAPVRPVGRDQSQDAGHSTTASSSGDALAALVSGKPSHAHGFVASSVSFAAALASLKDSSDVCSHGQRAQRGHMAARWGQMGPGEGDTAPWESRAFLRATFGKAYSGLVDSSSDSDSENLSVVNGHASGASSLEVDGVRQRSESVTEKWDSLDSVHGARGNNKGDLLASRVNTFMRTHRKALMRVLEKETGVWPARRNSRPHGKHTSAEASVPHGNVAKELNEGHTNGGHHDHQLVSDEQSLSGAPSAFSPTSSFCGPPPLGEATSAGSSPSSEASSTPSSESDGETAVNAVQTLLRAPRDRTMIYLSDKVFIHVRRMPPLQPIEFIHLDQVPVPIVAYDRNVFEWMDLAVHRVFELIDGQRTVADIIFSIAAGTSSTLREVFTAVSGVEARGSVEAPHEERSETRGAASSRKGNRPEETSEASGKGTKTGRAWSSGVTSTAAALGKVSRLQSRGAPAWNVDRRTPSGLSMEGDKAAEDKGNAQRSGRGTTPTVVVRLASSLQPRSSLGSQCFANAATPTMGTSMQAGFPATPPKHMRDLPSGQVAKTTRRHSKLKRVLKGGTEGGDAPWEAAPASPTSPWPWQHGYHRTSGATIDGVGGFASGAGVRAASVERAAVVAPAGTGTSLAALPVGYHSPSLTSPSSYNGMAPSSFPAAAPIVLSGAAVQSGGGFASGSTSSTQGLPSLLVNVSILPPLNADGTLATGPDDDNGSCASGGGSPPGRAQSSPSAQGVSGTAKWRGTSPTMGNSGAHSSGHRQRILIELPQSWEAASNVVMEALLHLKNFHVVKLLSPWNLHSTTYCTTAAFHAMMQDAAHPARAEMGTYMLRVAALEKHDRRLHMSAHKLRRRLHKERVAYDEDGQEAVQNTQKADLRQPAVAAVAPADKRNFFPRHDPLASSSDLVAVGGGATERASPGEAASPLRDAQTPSLPPSRPPFAVSSGSTVSTGAATNRSRPPSSAPLAPTPTSRAQARPPPLSLTPSENPTVPLTSADLPVKGSPAGPRPRDPRRSTDDGDSTRKQLPRPAFTPSLHPQSSYAPPASQSPATTHLTSGAGSLSTSLPSLAGASLLHSITFSGRRGGWNMTLTASAGAGCAANGVEGDGTTPHGSPQRVAHRYPSSLSPGLPFSSAKRHMTPNPQLPPPQMLSLDDGIPIGPGTESAEHSTGTSVRSGNYLNIASTLRSSIAGGSSGVEDFSEDRARHGRSGTHRGNPHEPQDTRRAEVGLDMDDSSTELGFEDSTFDSDSRSEDESSSSTSSATTSDSAVSSSDNEGKYRSSRRNATDSSSSSSEPGMGRQATCAGVDDVACARTRSSSGTSSPSSCDDRTPGKEPASKEDGGDGGSRSKGVQPSGPPGHTPRPRRAHAKGATSRGRQPLASAATLDLPALEARMLTELFDSPRDADVRLAASAVICALGKLTNSTMAAVRAEMRLSPAWGTAFNGWSVACCKALVETAVLNGWLEEVGYSEMHKH